jgi:hypothetical protein
MPLLRRLYPIGFLTFTVKLDDVTLVPELETAASNTRVRSSPTGSGRTPCPPWRAPQRTLCLSNGTVCQYPADQAVIKIGQNVPTLYPVSHHGRTSCLHTMGHACCVWFMLRESKACLFVVLIMQRTTTM